MAGSTNLGVELFYSDAWNHARSYPRQTVKASWGLRDEGDAMVPAKANAQLDNRELNYSPDDARSPLYGLVGRNTPGRITRAPGLTSGSLADTSDAFARTLADSWGSADTGGAWTTVSTAADYDVAGGFGTQSVPSANLSRRAYLSAISVRDVDIAVTFKVAQATGADLEPANILLRGTSESSYVMVRVVVTTTNTVTIQAFNRLNLSIDPAVTVPSLTHAGTGTPLRVRVLAVGQRLYARVWNPAGTEPSVWHMAVTDDLETPAAGFVGVRSGRAFGNSNTSPVVFSYDNWESTTYITIADGSVSSWQPDQAPGNTNDKWTDIEITGPSQRVNASKVVKSPLRSTLDASIAAGAGPAVYWPMEGYEREPDFVLSAVPGVPNASHTANTSTVTARFDWKGDDTLPGSKNLPVLSGNRTLIAGIIGAPISITPNDSFGMAMWTRTPNEISGISHGVITQAIQTFSCADGITGYSLVLSAYPPGSTVAAVPANGEVQVRVNLTLSGVIDQTLNMTGLPYSDQWRFVTATMEPDGADVEVTIHLDDVLVGLGTFTAVTLQQVVRTTVNAFQQDTTGNVVGTLAIGHPMAFGDTQTAISTLTAKVYQAGLGYPAESGATRFLRLCRERGIPRAVYGSDSHVMGTQPTAVLAELLSEIGRTDGGMIYDGRGWNGLEFRTNASIRNRDAVLALTFGEGGDVHTPLRPATDDLGITNDVTANSRDGSTYRVERTSGPNNVNDPTDDPEGIGRTESSIDANPSDQGELQDIAAWGLHVGTWPGQRYKNVTVDLSKHSELLAAAASIRPGDLITIDDLDADQVQLIVLGGVDSVPTHDHRVTFNCAPAGPWRIGEAGTAGSADRLGSASSTLTSDFNAGVATSMSVTIAAGGSLWSTTAEPYHIRVGGIVLNVTATTGATSPQTFTVDATPVNGITRVIPAGSRIDVESPVYVGR
jgi:hypothetical protein